MRVFVRKRVREIGIERGTTERETEEKGYECVCLGEKYRFKMRKRRIEKRYCGCLL